MLIGKGIFVALEHTITIARLISRVFPYNWDPKEFKLSINTNPKEVKRWKMLCNLFYTYTIYLIISLRYPTEKERKHSLHVIFLMLHLVSTLFFVLSSLLLYNINIRGRALCAFINATIIFSQEMTDKYEGDVAPSFLTERTELFFGMLGHFYMSVAVASGVLLSQYPFIRQLPSSFVSGYIELYPSLIIPFMFVQCWIYIGVSLILTLYIFAIFPTSIIAINLLKELKFNPKAPVLRNTIRYVNNFAFVYRELQVLYRLFDDCICRFLSPPHTVLVCSLSIICNYCVVAYPNGDITVERMILFIMSILILTYIIACYTIGGYQYKYSAVTLNSWKIECDGDRYLQKFLRSSLPLTIKLGSFHKVTNMTAYTIVLKVLQYSGKLIVVVK